MFFYFGYGSNINLVSLKAKGVIPLSSEPAVLPGWKLKFNVQHWFQHEGGMANIEPSKDSNDLVEGMLHYCADEQLASLDTMESYGVGYGRIEVEVKTRKEKIKAQTYIGLADFINNECLPTRRYLNILLKGTKDAGLSQSYMEKLSHLTIMPEKKLDEFKPPPGNWPHFTSHTLCVHPTLTALSGHVFEMHLARPKLQHLIGLLGGKDMTLFFVKRHDSSSGNETEEDIRTGNISVEAKNYINSYLHEFAKEYNYAGVLNELSASD